VLIWLLTSGSVVIAVAVDRVNGSTKERISWSTMP
jgi:hypothetical protein